MALWRCPVCGYEVENRCKPRKCPQCDDKRNFEKQEKKEDSRK